MNEKKEESRGKWGHVFFKKRVSRLCAVVFMQVSGVSLVLRTEVCGCAAKPWLGYAERNAKAGGGDVASERFESKRLAERQRRHCFLLPPPPNPCGIPRGAIAQEGEEAGE